MPDSTPTLAPAQPYSAPLDRTARYCARLDAHLDGLPSDADRRRFLSDQHVDWIARYDRFCLRVEAGEEPHFGEDAYDYVLTIAEIGARKARLERKAVAS